MLMKKDMKDEIIVGLDIGTTKICAIVGRVDAHNKLEILGMGRTSSMGVRQGVVRNLEKTTQAIQKAIQEASDRSQTDLEIVSVGIASQHVECSRLDNMNIRTSPEDIIAQDEVDALTRAMYTTAVEPGAEIVHIVPQGYRVDEQEDVDPVGMIGSKLEAKFSVVTARTADIKLLFKCVRNARLSAKQLILEPLASSLAVLSEDEKKAGVVLVDIGGGTTDMAIFYEGVMRHTAVIPFGGQSITKDIREGCKLLEADAETLKVQYGSAIASLTKPNEYVAIAGLENYPPKEISLFNLASIIQARLEEIIEMVYSKVQEVGYLDKIAAGIVLTGGGAQMQSIRQLVEYKTGYCTRIGSPSEHIVGAHAEDIKGPMYATAVGLMLSEFHPKAPQWTSKRTTSDNPKKRKGWNGVWSLADWTKNQLTDDLSEME